MKTMQIEQPKITDPRKIEQTSMAIIEPFLADFDLKPGEKEIYQRIIHTTGDPSIASAIRLSPSFVEGAVTILKSGCTIITDVEMIKAGINGSNLAVYGNKVECAIRNPEVASLAQELGTTRAATAVRFLAESIEGNVFAVGNAPTALFEILRLVMEEDLRPAVIIGVPVGFVGAVESKDLLVSLAPELEQRKIGWISLQGTRGGSTIATAIINALLILATRGEDV